MKGTAALLVLFCLAGCQAAAPRPSDGLPGLTLVPAPGGLLVEGSGGREIGFGRDRQGVIETVTRVEGLAPVRSGLPAGCAGRSAVMLIDGTQLIFRGQVFSGWATGTATAGDPCARVLLPEVAIG